MSVWLVSAVGLAVRRPTSTPASRSMSVDDPAEDVAADPADDGGRHAHLGQIDGHVGRAAADGQQHAVGHDQLARGRQVRDGRADVVGDDDAGAQDVNGLGHDVRLVSFYAAGEAVNAKSKYEFRNKSEIQR